jgi:hypothetical protein
MPDDTVLIANIGKGPNRGAPLQFREQPLTRFSTVQSESA